MGVTAEYVIVGRKSVLVEAEDSIVRAEDSLIGREDSAVRSQVLDCHGRGLGRQA